MREAVSGKLFDGGMQRVHAILVVLNTHTFVPFHTPAVGAMADKRTSARAAALPGTPDHESVALLTADLRELCATLTDTHGSASANVARARETIYGAQAHFRIIRARQERNSAS